MLDQKDVFNQQKYLIDRDIELDKYISTGQIVIVSGRLIAAGFEGSHR